MRTFANKSDSFGVDALFVAQHRSLDMALTKEKLIGDYDWGALCLPTVPWSKSTRKMPFFARNDDIPILVAAVMVHLPLLLLELPTFWGWLLSTWVNRMAPGLRMKVGACRLALWVDRTDRDLERAGLRHDDVVEGDGRQAVVSRLH